MRFILASLILFSCFTVFANGAAIDGSSLTRTGNIVYLQKENIKIEKESISIVFENDVFKFNVQYKLKNSSDKYSILAQRIDIKGDSYSGSGRQLGKTTFESLSEFRIFRQSY